MAEKDLMTYDDKDIAIFDDDLFTDEGTGLEEATADDFATPLIRILQPQNPQQMEASDKYIPGAKAGMFWNNAAASSRVGKSVTGVLTNMASISANFWLNSPSVKAPSA